MKRWLFVNQANIFSFNISPKFNYGYEVAQTPEGAMSLGEKTGKLNGKIDFLTA
jgi:hypothetical protein